ncbi:methyltransferase domain-containing protein [Rothia nasimurium]|uniref:Methyltransferase domain-containing protein n=2 Tax=Rothia nasimurium TaxID=85336 RepID=A0A4Y9F1V4_9MICC|nr:methyltransferase [Rothia nasimurium]TFU20567.1 methyltransferase domain-containing protein [Rothia nasimurium]
MPLDSLSAGAASALDRLILADAASASDPDGATTGDVLVLDDPTGALALWALAHTAPGKHRVISRQRSYADALTLHRTLREKAPDAAARLTLAGLDTQGQVIPDTFGLYHALAHHHFTGSLVLGYLPKSHAALADLAHDVARYQAEQGSETTLILGGNTKHMSTSFNQTLARSFGQVRGLRGKGKHRCLLATAPAPASEAPRPAGTLQAVGGVFSGGKPDRGGQLLATNVLTDLVKQASTRSLTLVDLGCGNGSVTLEVLEHLPAGVEVARVWATDLDVDAARSAALNLGQDARVQVSWDDAGSRLPQGSADIVMLNPPFHTGTTVDLSLVGPLLDASLRLLAPGGQLYLVHNSHARYRQQVEERFEQVRQLERTPTFTVLTARAPLTEENQ